MAGWAVSPAQAGARAELTSRGAERAEDVLRVSYSEGCSPFSLDAIAETYYTRRGRISEVTFESWWEGPPPETDDFVQLTVARTYDRRGNVVRHETDQPFVGVTTIECEYDRHDRFVGRTLTSPWGPGPRFRAVYGSHGLLQQEVFEYDPDGDGAPNRIERVFYRYDQGHRIVRKTFDFELPDGTVWYRRTESVQYAPSGHLSRVVLEDDENLDGVPDSRESHYANWSSRGRLLSQGLDSDTNADGTPELAYQTTLAYDGRGHVSGQAYELDYTGAPAGGADGVTDYRIDTVNTSDEAGHIVRAVLDVYDYTGESVFPHSRQDNTYRFDRRGLLIGQVIADDNEADGVFESILTVTHRRNRRGDFVETLHEDGNGGEFASYRHVAYRYDRFGNRIEELETTYVTGEEPSGGSRFRYRYVQDEHKLRP
jgi:hypothetical protein